MPNVESSRTLMCTIGLQSSKSNGQGFLRKVGVTNWNLPPLVPSHFLSAWCVKFYSRFYKRSSSTKNGDKKLRCKGLSEWSYIWLVEVTNHPFCCLGWSCITFIGCIQALQLIWKLGFGLHADFSFYRNKICPFFIIKLCYNFWFSYMYFSGCNSFGDLHL